MRRMILGLREALQKRGLSLHPSKCKVQTNVENWQHRGQTSLDDGFGVEVLPEGEPLTVLGTSLGLKDVTQHEIPNRIATGWRLFWALKALLLNRHASVKRRLRLFDSTVGSCVLWCAQSWTPREDERRLLQTARRSMLRKIVGAARAPDEGYVSWIKRVTEKAEEYAHAARVRDWFLAHRRCKWAWAGHVARMPASTWAWRVATWRD